MIAFAIDPGVTTGWAALGEDGAILETGNWLKEDVQKGLADLLSKRIRQDHHVFAVVEDLRVSGGGDLADTLRDVVRVIGEVLHDYTVATTLVTPGVWKTSAVPAAPKVFAGERLTQHQQDAIRMGLWYLAKEHGLRFARCAP